MMKRILEFIRPQGAGSPRTLRGKERSERGKRKEGGTGGWLRAFIGEMGVGEIAKATTVQAASKPNRSRRDAVAPKHIPGQVDKSWPRH